MTNIFYHGSDKLFDKFDRDVSQHDGEIFVSPSFCKANSLCYTTRNGGYLYTVQIDESNENYRITNEWGNSNCQCRAYTDVSGFEIIKVERIEYDGKPVKELPCGSSGMILSRCSESNMNPYICEKINTMKREIRFTSGIIFGETRDVVLEILPELAPQFTQRKHFFEYYFEPIQIEVSIDQLDRLSKEFNVTLSWDEIKINE